MNSVEEQPVIRKRGRPAILTPEEKKAKYNEYHRQYYAKNRATILDRVKTKKQDLTIIFPIPEVSEE